MPHPHASLLAHSLLCASASSFRFASIFSNHTVLQRDAPTTVFGFATPGVSVTAAFNSLNYSGATDATGVWRVVLPATPAGTAADIHFSGSDGGKLILYSVLFGDVTFCGGQSNQAIPMSYIFNSTAEIAGADAFTAGIRVLQVDPVGGWPTPMQEVPRISIKWSPVSSSIVPSFSAACYLYGRDVYLRTGVPQGLIESCWGGTPIQAWSPPAGIQACDAPPSPTRAPGNASVLWNSMVAPFTLGPVAISAITWYQGEQNSFYGQAFPYYACALPRLLADWRAAFTLPALAAHGVEAPAPIWAGVVQLAPWCAEKDSNGNNSQVGDLRLAQLAAVGLPDTAVMTAIDGGDPGAPATAIHPRAKQLVGARLAMGALAQRYGLADQPYLSPVYAGAAATVRLDGPAVAVSVAVSFRPDTLYGGLVLVPPSPASNSSRCPTDLGVAAADCAWFELRASTGEWLNASSFGLTPDGQGVQLELDQAALPMRVAACLRAFVLAGPGSAAAVTITATRFGYASWPVVNVYNRGGLPLFPWMADVTSVATSSDGSLIL